MFDDSAFFAHTIRTEDRLSAMSRDVLLLHLAMVADANEGDPRRLRNTYSNRLKNYFTRTGTRIRFSPTARLAHRGTK
jgi:hypothetical protein